MYPTRPFAHSHAVHAQHADVHLHVHMRDSWRVGRVHIRFGGARFIVLSPDVHFHVSVCVCVRRACVWVALSTRKRARLRLKRKSSMEYGFSEAFACRLPACRLVSQKRSGSVVNGAVNI